MSEEKTTKTITATISKIFYVQQCLCCGNTRRLPDGMTYCRTSWICDECKEAMIFLKDFIKQATVAKDMLADLEESRENIHYL